MSDRPSLFSPRRVGVLASSTLTQLVRMKILWIMVLLFLGLGALGFFSARLSSSPVQELTTLKSVTLFVMGLFTELFAIAATALLIPRDIEDRTLYTILCRPVPRIEYLLGKFLGILALLGMALLVMDLALNLTLLWRQDVVIELQMQRYAAMGLEPDEIAAQRERLEGLGVSWSLQASVVTIFLRASIMAALTLLLSTFSTSTLFTQAIAVGAYAIGHLVAMARSEALTGDGWLARTFVGLVALIFPDLQMFNVNDAVIQGESVPASQLLELAGMGLAYVLVYLLLAWFIFADKEY